MKTTQDTEVLVLGAGPVGMFSALWLSERGIRVTIVDKYQRLALHKTWLTTTYQPARSD
jgi:2-polyprenyl-6-methoxyphenol hydroxylase-like FAD-dependent oxidoreductase